MSKHMDKQAQALTVMMNHHLTHQYTTEDAKQRNLDAHIKEFRHLDSMPVAYFSQGIWMELNQLFEGYSED